MVSLGREPVFREVGITLHRIHIVMYGNEYSYIAIGVDHRGITICKPIRTDLAMKYQEYIL